MAGYSDIEDAIAIFRDNPTFKACYGRPYCDGDVMHVCVYNRCNDEKNIIKRIEGCYDNNNVNVAWDPKAWKFIMKNRANDEWSMYPLQTSTTWKDGRWSRSRLRVDDQTYSDRLTSYEAYLQRVEATRRLTYAFYLRTYALYQKSTITWLSHTYTKDANACEANVKLSPNATACTILQKLFPYADIDDWEASYSFENVFREPNCDSPHSTHCNSYCVYSQQRCIMNYFARQMGYAGFHHGKAFFLNNPTFKQCYPRWVNGYSGHGSDAYYLQHFKHNKEKRFKNMAVCLQTKCKFERLGNSVEGCYGEKEYIGTKNENEWHYVRITGDEDTEQFTWRNRAGKEWTLKPVWEEQSMEWSTTKLAVGEDCPYFEDGHHEAALEYKDNTINIIRGPWDEPYTKDANACP